MSARLALVAMAAVLAALGLAAPSGAGTAPVERAPSRLLVNSVEWSYMLSRPKLPPGPAVVELHNLGEDPHDLKLRRLGGERTFAIDELGPDDSAQLELRLRGRSRYRLWCSLARHGSLGMSAKLIVARRGAAA